MFGLPEWASNLVMLYVLIAPMFGDRFLKEAIESDKKLEEKERYMVAVKTIFWPIALVISEYKKSKK